jgi:uncharacterized protein YceK
MNRSLYLLALLPLITGCGTFIARTGNPDAGTLWRFYPATGVDGALLTAPCNPNEEWGSMPRRVGATCIGLVDLPISLVTDTICFPFDLADYVRKRLLTLEQRQQMRDETLRERQGERIVEPATPPYSEPAARSPQR